MLIIMVKIIIKVCGSSRVNISERMDVFGIFYLFIFQGKMRHNFALFKIECRVVVLRVELMKEQ